MSLTSTTTDRPPVADWGHDYDVFDDAYVRDPSEFWAGMRAECPVATSERWGGSHLVLSYAAVVDAASNTGNLTSTRGTSIAPTLDDYSNPNRPKSIINSDPPDHAGPRRVILPSMSPASVAKWEPVARALCHRLIDRFIAVGRADAAVDYAQQIPARVIGLMLGVPEERTDEFIGWVREVLEHGAQFPERRLAAFEEMRIYFTAEMAARRENPTDDLISHLVHARMDDGTALTEAQILGNVTLLLLAGIDTTWSSIGSSLLHLAQNPIDQERLRTEPDLWPTAIEELLRAFAPVTMSRIATSPTAVAGCPVPHGRRVVISFPSANRDPEVFENPDEVRLDREHNRHLAFGSGIHRCAGSNLARMELRVSLQTWIERVGPFALADAGSVTWAGGQVRGPRSVPVTFTPGASRG